MRKTLLTILSLLLCITVLAGCGGGSTTKEKPVSTEPEQLLPESNISAELKEQQKTSDTLLSDDEIRYVMIYNPDLYDENIEINDLLSTGNFGQYIEATINKADGLTETPEFVPRSAAENNLNLDYSGFDTSGSRGGSFITPYKEGDTHEFYHGTDNRSLQTFVCMYAGESCNIWTYNNYISSEQAEEFAKEFDSKIYSKTTELFGKSRFAENGGKVNLLFYPLSEGLCGFFFTGDLWASDEVTPVQKSTYSINTDHDIININSIYVGVSDEITAVVKSTMAHEFQHLICFTNFFHTAEGTPMRTWLNEAMSGFIEEYIYPGSKETSGDYEAFTTSHRIRHGQSMYNFDTSVTESDWDTGVYGSVYLFSEYLSNLAGSDIFSKVHSYWRNSYSTTLDEAEAISKSVPTEIYDKINNFVDFENAVYFRNNNDEWLSKLTLDFYLSLVKVDNTDPKAFEKVKAQTLLYDEINPTEIEGGGRVIAALKDGEFKFPEDADKGLVYIGFNKDFEIVTDYVVR